MSACHKRASKLYFNIEIHAILDFAVLAPCFGSVPLS
jgi:hypothetical protein